MGQWTVTIDQENTLPESDNIVIGYACLLSIVDHRGIYWVLPGGKKTRSKTKALKYTIKLNNLIEANLVRRNRNSAYLIW